MSTLTLIEFSKQIAFLKKEKKFKEALAYFKENKKQFSKEDIAQNEYVISNIVFCLRNTFQFDAGFKFLEIYNIGIDENQKESVLNAYGWLLWSKFKAENNDISDSEETEVEQFFEDEDENSLNESSDFKKSEIIQKIEELIAILLQSDSDYPKTLISQLFSIVLKTEKKKAAPNWKMIDNFCSQIDPQVLSKECSNIVTEKRGEKKETELASDFENWYAYKTKALMKLGKWEECFNVSKEALELIDKFHYSNDIWLLRRIAISKKNLGNIDEAILELKSILKKKKEWFIQKELAELYFEKEDFDQSLKTAIESVMAPGPLEFKVDLLFLLGNILNKQEKSDLAFKHFQLSKLLRQEKEWKIPSKLIEVLREFSQPLIPLSDISILIKELRQYWNSLIPKPAKTTQEEGKNSASENLIGEVKSILHDNEKGKVGFINSGGTSYYFSTPSTFKLSSKIKLNAKVVFRVVPANGGKKEKAEILSVQ